MERFLIIPNCFLENAPLATNVIKWKVPLKTGHILNATCSTKHGSYYAEPMRDEVLVQRFAMGLLLHISYTVWMHNYNFFFGGILFGFIVEGGLNILPVGSKNQAVFSPRCEVSNTKLTTLLNRYFPSTGCRKFNYADDIWRLQRNINVSTV